MLLLFGIPILKIWVDGIGTLDDFSFLKPNIMALKTQKAAEYLCVEINEVIDDTLKIKLFFVFKEHSNKKSPTQSSLIIVI